MNDQAAYASAGTNVIKLNLLTGEALQTNSLCPLPGVARLDASGNYYFAGNFDGTQNFGGITLVGGWTNWPPPGHWTAGYPTHFVAKYNSAGVLQWVKSFGKQANNANQLTDLEVDSSGGVFVGHSTVESPGIATASITRFDSGGNLQWTVNVGAGTTVKLGNIVNTNLYYLNCGGSYLYVVAGRVDFNGSKLGYTPGPSLQIYASAATSNGKPAADDGQRLFVSGTTNGQQLLCKFDPSGSLVWAKNVNHGEQWPLARDASECFYFGSASNVLIKYDANGNELWSTNYQKVAIKMIVDSTGNRCVGFADGTIARLAPDETPQPPSVLVPPQNQIVFLRSNATFSATIGGSPTLYYQWRKDGTNLVGATATNYTIASVTTNQVGYYDVVVTNVYGAITSTPPAALLVSPSLLSPYVGAVGLWGQQATLSVSAWGSGTLTYQWYKAGQAITDATNSILVFPTVQISDAGAYSVVVTSVYGSVTNMPADLVVNPAEVSIALYAGITIHGTVGYSYGIEYTTNLQNATWLNLTNITLAQPAEIWVDTSVPAAERARRFYRVTNQ